MALGSTPINTINNDQCMQDDKIEFSYKLGNYPRGDYSSLSDLRNDMIKLFKHDPDNFSYVHAIFSEFLQWDKQTHPHKEKLIWLYNELCDRYNAIKGLV